VFNPDYRYTLNFVDAWSVDEVVVLDVTRTADGDRENFYDVVRQFADRCFVPLTAGGGVRTIEDVRNFLRIGADKVIVNTQALRQPEFITRCAKLFGAQCIVVSIDARKDQSGRYKVFSDFGTTATGWDPAAWAKKAQDLGAGEILITSIEKDGSLEGYDNQLNSMVAESVNIPVLVCGGAGKWQDFVNGFNIGKAQAVCTTNIYHFTETSIKSAKKYLKDAGILVRL